MYCKVFRILILVCLISFKVNSQEYKMSIEQIKTNEKILYGSIADKYDITLYLKVITYSEDHLSAYSVKGWYYYNSVKKNIPLVGISNPMGGLTLYSLKNKALEDKLAAFDLPGNTVWEKMDYAESIAEYEEKFTITGVETENKWKNKAKELSLKIYNFDTESSIDNELKFLKLDKDHVINLNDFDLNYSDLKIVTSVKTKSETRILLEYEYQGNANVQGRCGAATDTGYIILSFNSKNELNFIEELELDNCMNSVYSEPIKTNNKDLWQFKIITSGGDKDVERKVTVDTKAIAFRNEK